jgi:iron complex outermembrane receptor protein
MSCGWRLVAIVKQADLKKTSMPTNIEVIANFVDNPLLYRKLNFWLGETTVYQKSSVGRICGHFVWVAVTISLLGFGGAALGQGLFLEEVIVTAQKRNESIQDVPIAITSFTGEQMKDLGFTNSTEIARYSPGVSQSGGGGDQQQFTIRGATQNDFGDQAESPNAVYLDEVYQAAQQAALFATYDLQRVEILKGPQGTLFGRNATGGLLHFVSEQPSQEFDAFADVTYGSYDQIRTEGAIGGGLTDTISARVSGVFSTHDPIFNNTMTAADLPAVPPALAAFGRPVFDPEPEFNDPWSQESYSVRGQLLFEPNEDVAFTLKGQVGRQEFGGPGYLSRPTVAVVGDTNTNGVIDPADGVVNNVFQSEVRTLCEQLSDLDGSCVNSIFDADFDGVRPNNQGDFYGDFETDGDGLNTQQDFVKKVANQVDIWTVSGKLTWDLDWAKLTSVSAFTSMEQYKSLDVGNAPIPRQHFASDFTNDWFTQELRLEGEQDRYRWIVGLYYLNVDVRSAQTLEDRIGGNNTFGGLFFGPVLNGGLNIITGEAGPGVGGDTFLEGTTDVDLETNSYSVFGQIDYDINDQFTINAGIRLIIEEKDYSFTNRLYRNVRDGRTDGAAFGGGEPLAVIFAPGIPVEFLPPFSDSTSDFLWSGKLQLNWTPNDDLLIYGGVNRGVKAGNFNAPLLTPLAANEYNYKEEVLLTGEFGFKATIFDGRARLNGAAYYYDYTNYQGFQFVGTSGAVFNADAEYYGGELELLATPVENFDLWLGLSAIDTTIKSLQVAANTLRDVEPTYTPDLTFTAVGRYTWPNVLAGGSITVQVDGTYADSAFANINNFDTHRMPSSWVGNSNIRWTSADGHWEVGGFVHNFSDSRVVNSIFDLAAVDGTDEVSYEKPRWWGANVRYNF